MPLCCTKPTRELGQRLQAAVLPPTCMECLTRMTSRKERAKAKMVRKERGKQKIQIKVQLRAMVKSQRRKGMPRVSDVVAQAISLQIVMPRKTRMASRLKGSPLQRKMERDLVKRKVPAQVLRTKEKAKDPKVRKSMKCLSSLKANRGLPMVQLKVRVPMEMAAVRQLRSKQQPL